MRGGADGFALAHADEGLAGLLARDQVLDRRQEAVAAGARQQQRGIGRAGEVVHGLGAGLEFDQRGDGLAVAARTRQAGHRHGIHTAVAAEDDQRVHRPAFKRAVQAVAGLEGEAGGLVAVAGARAHPALAGDHHGDRLVHHLDLGHGLFLGLDQRAARVGEGLGVGLDLLDHQALEARRVGQDVFELALLLAQFLEFLLDLDRFELRQLTQADFEDVFGLALAELERLDQRGLGLVAVANDADHLVDVQQHQLPAFEDVDAVQHLLQPMLAAAGDGGLAEGDPLFEHLAQALLRRPAVQPDHGQVDRRRGFQAGVGQQRGDQFLLLDAAALGLEHQAHRRLLARLVAHAVQHHQHAGLELGLVLRQGLLARLDLGVGDFLDLLQHLLAAHARRQFVDHELPLAAREVLDLPARAHLEAAATGAVGVGDVAGRADDLATAGVVRAGQDREQLVVGQLGVLDQGHTGVGHLAQVVAGDLGRQAHGDAAGAVEQVERQARGQLFGLFERTIVGGDEVHRALVDLVEQQAGDLGQPRFGVTHGGGAVAVAAAEVALAIDQRIALGKVLRHAHQRVVGGAVAVRVVLAEHVANHAGAFDRLGRRIATEAQAHAVHGVEDAALHRLLAVGHIGQGPALDDREGVFEVGALGVGGEGVVCGCGRGVNR